MALLAGAASRLPLSLLSPEMDVVYGRALSVLDVYDSPLPGAVVTKRLFPDSVVPIVETVPDWYGLADGYAKRSGIQPMMLTVQTIPTPSLPYWAEVSGAVAVVRRWCAADAPLVARIGHGGVAQVVDMLLGDHQDWYALADEDSFLGWSSASTWTLVEERSFEDVGRQLHINTATRELHFLEADQPVLLALIMLGTPINLGTYSVQRRKHSVMFPLDSASDAYGVPWSINFGSYSLAGTYWHNDFGTNKIVPGPSIQVAPAVARWLYERLPEGTEVIVR